MKKIITSSKAPAAIGPYSQAVEMNDMLFLSGQIPLNPQTGEIVGEDITAQTQQVLSNLQAVLEEAGYSIEQVVKTTCYLSDLTMFAVFNKAYEACFASSKPARATVEVSALPKGVLVEIDAIACK